MIINKEDDCISTKQDGKIIILITKKSNCNLCKDFILKSALKVKIKFFWTTRITQCSKLLTLWEANRDSDQGNFTVPQIVFTLKIHSSSRKEGEMFKLLFLSLIFCGAFCLFSLSRAELTQVKCMQHARRESTTMKTFWLQKDYSKHSKAIC